MATNDEEEMHLSPSDSDKSILQRSGEDSSEATTTPVATGFMNSSVTDPGLVMKTLRVMSAKVEELQQESLQSRQAASYREILIERRFKEQEKQITALKRKRCDSCSIPSSANSSSTAKQPRKSSTVSQTEWFYFWINPSHFLTWLVRFSEVSGTQSKL